MNKKNVSPIDPDVLRQIPLLRSQGLSSYKIADKLGIGESTVRKHKNYRPPTQKPTTEYKFTKRQIEIAVEAAKKNARK